MALTVEDHLEIEQLAARYNLAIDLGDAQGWAECYTEDGEFRTEPGGPWSESRGMTRLAVQGQAELLAFAEAVTAGGKVRHWSTNRVVTQTADGARAVSYMTVFVLTGPRADEFLTGVMEDELVHTNDGWRFRRRSIEFDR